MYSSRILDMYDMTNWENKDNVEKYGSTSRHTIPSYTLTRNATTSPREIITALKVHQTLVKRGWNGMKISVFLGSPRICHKGIHVAHPTYECDQWDIGQSQQTSGWVQPVKTQADRKVNGTSWKAYKTDRSDLGGNQGAHLNSWRERKTSRRKIQKA